jgi:mannosyltransferase
LVPPGDVVAMAAAVAGLLADADQRRHFGSAARERVAREFSLAREAEGINAVYGRLWDASA